MLQPSHLCHCPAQVVRPSVLQPSHLCHCPTQVVRPSVLQMLDTGANSELLHQVGMWALCVHGG